LARRFLEIRDPGLLAATNFGLRKSKKAETGGILKKKEVSEQPVLVGESFPIDRPGGAAVDRKKRLLILKRRRRRRVRAGSRKNGRQRITTIASWRCLGSFPLSSFHTILAASLGKITVLEDAFAAEENKTKMYRSLDKTTTEGLEESVSQWGTSRRKKSQTIGTGVPREKNF